MNKRNLPAGIAERLGIAITEGHYPIGALLPPEPELCERFSVSRTVIREAVKALVAKGMIQTASGKGTWVLPRTQWNYLDPDVFSWIHRSDGSEVLVGDLFAFRRAIEPSAAEAAALSHTPAQLQEIAEALGRMERAIDDREEWIAADIDFHIAIYIASNNVFMNPLVNIFRQFFTLSFSLSSAHRHHQHCLDEHRAVYERIAARDAVGARKAIFVLLDGADDDARAILDAAKVRAGREGSGPLRRS